MKIDKNMILLAGLVVGVIAFKYIIVEGYYQKKAAGQQWTLKTDDDDAYQGRITLSS